MTEQEPAQRNPVIPSVSIKRFQKFLRERVQDGRLTPRAAREDLLGELFAQVEIGKMPERKVKTILSVFFKSIR